MSEAKQWHGIHHSRATLDPMWRVKGKYLETEAGARAARHVRTVEVALDPRPLEPLGWAWASTAVGCAVVHTTVEVPLPTLLRPCALHLPL